MTLVLNGTTGITVDGVLTANVLGGATTAAVNDGTYSSGTYTPVTTGGNMRYITNNGAFTLAAPSGTSFAMVIQITNGASAGAITLSGFTFTVGDPFTTTNGNRFFLNITKINTAILASVVALQ
jgi:hypothetical protein